MVDAAVDISSSRRLGRAVWAVSLPILFAGISETVIRVTDTAFLARIGAVELGAFALADTLLDVWLVPVIGLVEAMVIVVGRRVGQRRGQAVRSTFVTGMFLTLLASLMLAVTMWAGASWVAGFLAESADIGRAIEQYLRIAALGLVFLSLNLGYSALYTGLARTKVLVGTAVIISLTNFSLSYVLILGRLGFPELGIEGAALSFVAAEVAGFAYLAAYTARHRVLAPGVESSSTAERGPYRLLLRLSPPVALRALVEGVRWLLFFMIMEQVGTEAVASANVIYACFATMLIATDALGDTAYSLVSNVVGRGEEQRLRGLLRQVIGANYVLTLPLVALATLAPGVLLWVFGLDGAGLPSAAPDLRVAALGVLCMVPAEMWIAAVAGTGDTDAAFAIEVVTSVVFVLWTYWTMVVIGLTTPVAWFALALTALISLPIAYWWVRSGRWRRRRL